MFITIVGWIIIICAIVGAIGGLSKDKDGNVPSAKSKITTVIVAVIVAFVGLYAAGHSSRVATAKRESISSSRAESSSTAKDLRAASSKVSKDDAKDAKNGKLFIRDFNAYLSNKDDGKAALKNDVITVTMPAKVDNMTVADFKAEAQDIYDHAQTLASGEDYTAGTIYFNSQNGGQLARSTFGGGIKIYKN